tara:strand:+ start:75 stop:905 length:831 start_codon:yes stop_codon:yes gene_type:complete
MKKEDGWGWTIEPNVLSDYSDVCLKISEDENLFRRFKKIKEYRPVLEGGPKALFDTYLQHIKQLKNYNLFFENLEKFRINDTVGDPDIYEDPTIGKFSGSTFKFAFNALEIIYFIESQGKDLKSIKNIVEVGGGYGGLCLILSGFIDFDSYTLMDLPNVCKLTDKYIEQFPQLHGKVKTLPCTDLTDQSFDSIDLAIGVNSLSECNREVQLSYFSKIISKSEFSYIVRNPDTQERWQDHLCTIESLDDSFSVDYSEKIERSYSNQTVVYIKKDGVK